MGERPPFVAAVHTAQRPGIHRLVVEMDQAGDKIIIGVGEKRKILMPRNFATAAVVQRLGVEFRMLQLYGVADQTSRHGD